MVHSTTCTCTTILGRIIGLIWLSSCLLTCQVAIPSIATRGNKTGVHYPFKHKLKKCKAILSISCSVVVVVSDCVGEVIYTLLQALSRILGLGLQLRLQFPVLLTFLIHFQLLTIDFGLQGHYLSTKGPMHLKASYVQDVHHEKQDTQQIFGGEMEDKDTFPPPWLLLMTRMMNMIPQQYSIISQSWYVRPCRPPGCFVGLQRHLAGTAHHYFLHVQQRCDDAHINPLVHRWNQGHLLDCKGVEGWACNHLESCMYSQLLWQQSDSLQERSHTPFHPLKST